MIMLPLEKDGDQIHAITANNTVFNQEEVDCIDELWEEYLAHGSELSGYYFLVEKERERCTRVLLLWSPITYFRDL